MELQEDLTPLRFYRRHRTLPHEALYACCERRGWSYVVKLRVTPDLASRIWTHASEGRWRRIETAEDTVLEVAVLRFPRPCWNRPRRVSLTRRRDPANPQGHLWDALGSNYAAYVTDLAWAPEEIAAFSDKRADIEKTIHELTEDFGIDRVPTGRFLPNAADLERKVLAFNLLVLYPRQALGWPVLQRAKTLRRRVVALAGQLIRPAGQWILKLAEGWRWQADLLHARPRLAALGPSPPALASRGLLTAPARGASASRSPGAPPRCLDARLRTWTRTQTHRIAPQPGLMLAWKA